jgi:hypothetical protein
MSMVARFVKVWTPEGDFDEDNSYWTVCFDDEVILKSVVKDIKRQYGVSYSVLHSIDFGKHLIFKAKSMRAFW